MRKTKFRAWLPGTKEMLYKGSRMDLWGYSWLYDGGLLRAIPLHYIGLHDQNGAEIYEGDIVREPDNHYQRIRLVKWYDYGFKLIPIKHTIGVMSFMGGRKREAKNKDIEVIGNSYENPELLKGE